MNYYSELFARNMDCHLNENIKNTFRVFPKQGRLAYHRYDANENPEGLPVDFVNSVLSEITPEYLALYPEPDLFLRKYAEYLGVKFENVYATNGSDHGIRVLLETFGEPGKEVVTVMPSFEIYWVCCSLLGMRHVAVPYNEDLTIDTQAILDAINENTRVIALLNPNSPIGNLYTDDDVRQVVNKAKQVGSLVIIDEAYHYFYDKSFLDIALCNDNVLLLRTFSKLMSLAGCRLGTVIGMPETINFVKNSRLAYEVNGIALLFGERILEHPDLINDLIRQEKEGKEFFLEVLRANGYWCMDGHGNYVLVKPKLDAHEIAKRLETEKKTLVHPYGNELMKDMIRVTVGSKESMAFFMEQLLEVDSL